MFHQTLVADSTTRPWTKGVGLLWVSMMAGAWVLYSTWNYAPFPAAQLRKFLVAPAPPRPVAVRVVSVQRAPLVTLRSRPTEFYQPTSIPDSVADINEVIPPPLGIGFVPQALPDTTTALSESLAFSAPPVPPPPAVPAIERIFVGGDVQAAKLLAQVKPVYPSIAKMARVQGTVRLEALINRDGVIENVRVISGPPLLIQAALDAVTQWRYQPTLLNGVPVEVSTMVEVNFSLN